MTSPAQRAANRSNPHSSTRSVTSRHGFRSQTVLLPGDDPAEYEALLLELTKHFAPDDLTETRFVREMTDAEWRLRRVREHLECAIARRMAVLIPIIPT